MACDTLLPKLSLFVCLGTASVIGAQNIEESFPQVDAIAAEAVRGNLIPGAVILVGHRGQTVFRKAYGSRAILPGIEPMTLDTIFDAASLTKVVATTPSIMKLFEAGKIRLNDPVTKYLPDFQGGKSDITIRLLMTHFSGLPPDLLLKPRWSGYETGIQKALTTVPVAPPGARFIYSDINFLLLGEIVRRQSGKTLAQFAHDEIYAPLQMKESGFQPSPGLRPRIAPTELDEDTKQPMRGVVDDPTARYMGGIAGDAGLFTTADDLAKYAEMLLGGGERGGTRIFQPATIRKFIEPNSPADQPILRGLGWDVDSPFSSNRGELFPIGSFGHTGYTGTSLWIDPATDTYVIILTNVVHPKHGNSLTSFRSRIATAIAAHYDLQLPNTVALTGYNDTISGAGVHRTVARNGETATGLDVLEMNGFADLKNKKIGLITNHTGLDRQGSRNVDQMLAAGVQVTSLFAPEHGLGGNKDDDVSSGRDPKTGLPVISLYQQNSRRPTPDQLAKLDAVVFDIQDAGARFYTYSCTLLYSLEAAARSKKAFYVLDRPNPVTGTHVEGPVLTPGNESFLGCYDIPLRHGMTLGELATMANSEKGWAADLHVVKMKNWQRGDWFDSTDLTWVNLSPNMRSLNAAILYPGVAMLEAETNYSVGRGTDSPFEQIGASWMSGLEISKALNARMIPGIRTYPTRFRPTESNFAGQEIQGVRFVITDREAFDSTRFGIELAALLRDRYPGSIHFQKNKQLIGSLAIADELEAGRDTISIENDIHDEVDKFLPRRSRYLLY